MHKTMLMRELKVSILLSHTNLYSIDAKPT